jgi:hypothetical protein
MNKHLTLRKELWDLVKSEPNNKAKISAAMKAIGYPETDDSMVSDVGLCGRGHSELCEYDEYVNVFYCVL